MSIVPQDSDTPMLQHRTIQTQAWRYTVIPECFLTYRHRPGRGSYTSNCYSGDPETQSNIKRIRDCGLLKQSQETASRSQETSITFWILIANWTFVPSERDVTARSMQEMASQGFEWGRTKVLWEGTLLVLSCGLYGPWSEDDKGGGGDDSATELGYLLEINPFLSSLLL
jgi:hypothetical protein